MWEAHNWQRTERVVIGVYTFIGVAAGLAVIVTALLWPDEGLEHVLRPSAAWLLYLSMPAMVLLMTALYAPAAFANRRITRGARVAWLTGFAAAGIVAMPLYWWFHVMNAPYGPMDDGVPEADPRFWLRPPAGGARAA